MLPQKPPQPICWYLPFQPAPSGIHTSSFQLYDAGNGKVAVTLNNFCKLQEMGADDEDDILSCVSFLLADVVHAKQLIGADLH